MQKCHHTLIITGLLFFLSTMPALAHKINVFAHAAAGQVYVESYFADGRPVKQSRILVFDSTQALLLEGKTDDEGLFDFPIPKVDTLTIEIREILGHRNRYTLPQAEVAAGMSTQAPN